MLERGDAVKIVNILVTEKGERKISELSGKEKQIWSQRISEEAMKRGNYSRKQS